MATLYHVRSSSLPARLHSNSLNHIHQLLNKLPTDNHNSHFSVLSQLYDSVSSLFNDSPSSLLVPHHNFLTHLLDISLVHLDLCSKLRDITCRIKDRLCDLRSAFRRRRYSGESTIRCHVKAFIRYRKAIHKDLAKLLLSLKETDLSSFVSSGSSHPLITLLTQVCSQTCHSFRTVLLSFSTSVQKPKHSKWALVTKLVIKKVSSRAQVQTGQRSEFQMMDEELRRFCSAKEIKKDRIKSVITSLDQVDVAVEDLEDSLESLYRRMIQTRVSLLNILSLHL